MIGNNKIWLHLFNEIEIFSFVSLFNIIAKIASKNSGELTLNLKF